MTRSLSAASYDDDFFAWTQQQAAALREVQRHLTGNRVDIEHVAEEIEDLGKRDLREVTSFLARFFEHLVKIESCPASPDLLHWRSEARNVRRAAQEAFSPGMRQLLNLQTIWRKGRKMAREALDDIGVIPSAPADCPFDLDDLLSEDCDLDAALAKLATAKDPLRRDAPGS